MGTLAWISAGWRVYRENWGRILWGILALMVFHFLLMALGGGLPLLFPFLSAPAPEALGKGDIPGWVLVVFLVLNFTVGTMLYLGYSYFILRIVRGERPSVLDLLYPFRRPIPVIAVTVLYYLGVAAGLLLLIIPGIIFAVVYLFADIALIDRRLSPGEAFGESAELTRGHRLPLFFLLIFFWILGGLLNFLGENVEGAPIAMLLVVLANFLVFPWSYAALMCAYDDLLKGAHPPEVSALGVPGISGLGPRAPGP